MDNAMSYDELSYQTQELESKVQAFALKHKLGVSGQYELIELLHLTERSARQALTGN